MRRPHSLNPKLSKFGRVQVDEVKALNPYMTHRGRGALSNPDGRFEVEQRVEFDDGWGSEHRDKARNVTSLTAETARTVITFNQSPDIHFDRSINPYRGCEHGCIYCFARPSHAYQGLSSGLDFESRLFYKPDAPDLLRRELAAPNYQPRPIVLGINTDAFQPVERDKKLTRELLTILAAHNHPVTLLTKSALILRDIDIIAPLAEKGLCRVGVSITTLDRTLARRMEPRAATPARRLETIASLSAAGIPVTAMTAPIIPALNDHEIEALLETIAEAGAKWAGYVMLRLPYEIKDLFHEWLAQHYPDRSARVINHLRDMHGGRDYNAEWFTRGRGKGAYAQLIAARFAKAIKRFGLDAPRPPLRTDLFTIPPKPGDQMELCL